MIINLADIPEEGRSYVWNSNTGELNEKLKDLIKGAPYDMEFSIRPINHKDFELRGHVKTASPESCSRCGLDFRFSVLEKFHEILIPRQPEDRQGKYSKVNHVSESFEEGPGSVEYKSNQTFDMGEYTHQVVALAIPFNPIPEEDREGRCVECKLSVKGQSFSYDEALPKEDKPNPFNVLKNLKLQ